MIRIYWKLFVIKFFIAVYSIYYYRRKSIAWGRIGDRIEIYAVRWKDTHKCRIAYPLRTIKL